uniref:Uncharacterized protein n=1 Tax=Arundo donax TaxID=35708 RepID=A0A0A9BI98_ARUDO
MHCCTPTLASHTLAKNCSFAVKMASETWAQWRINKS